MLSRSSYLLLLLALSPLAALHAANFSVGPVRVTMSSESPTATIELRSGDFKNPILLQATAYSWTQKDGERVLEPDTDLQVSPAVLKLEPGDVRSLLLSSTAELESPRYYRVRIEEVEAEANRPATNQLAFLKVFDIPVFVEPPGARPELESSAVLQDDGSLKVTLTNRGNAQVAATSFQVLASAETSATNVLRELAHLVYVLPGSERIVEIPAVDPDTSASIAPDILAAVLSDSGSLVVQIQGTVAGETIARVPIARAGSSSVANN